MNIVKKVGAAALLIASFGVTTSSLAANEHAENIGAALGGAVGGAYGGNAGGAAGALAGLYGVRVIDNAITKAVDTHFDKLDQKFANEHGVTIQYPDGKIFKPQ